MYFVLLSNRKCTDHFDSHVIFFLFTDYELFISSNQIVFVFSFIILLFYLQVPGLISGGLQAEAQTFVQQYITAAGVSLV